MTLFHRLLDRFDRWRLKFALRAAARVSDYPHEHIEGRVL